MKYNRNLIRDVLSALHVLLDRNIQDDIRPTMVYVYECYVVSEPLLLHVAVYSGKVLESFTGIHSRTLSCTSDKTIQCWIIIFILYVLAAIVVVLLITFYFSHCTGCVEHLQHTLTGKASYGTYVYEDRVASFYEMFVFREIQKIKNTLPGQTCGEGIYIPSSVLPTRQG